MVIDWADKKEYSHGFLIPLISGYIIWSKRETLRNIPLMPDVKGLFILGAGIFLLILGDIAFEPFTRRFSLIVTILGLIYFLFGSKMCKVLLFPIGYLFFMIPLPYILIKSIAVNLRLISAKVTYGVLNSFGVPILQDGVNLELPNMSLVVGDLCTGILSLVAIMALAVLYAYLTQRNLICKVALVIFAVPAAIFSNMLRLIMTVGLAYFYGPRILGNFIHQFHGTVNFFITVVLLVLIGRFVKRLDIRISNRRLP
jgi:exosortase